MLNQISQANINSRNILSSMQTSGVPFSIATALPKTQEEKEEHKNVLGFEIVLAAIGVGAAAFALSKGVPTPIRKSFYNFLENIDNKVQLLKSNKKLTGAQELYLSALEGTKNVANKSKVIFNVAPLKDVLLRAGIKKVPFLTKFDKNLTEIFEKISIKKYEAAYSTTLVSFDQMESRFALANKKLTKPQAKEADKLMRKLGAIYKDNFGSKVRQDRLNSTKNLLKGLDEDVWNATYGNFKGYVKNKNSYQTFISEEMAAPAKIQLANQMKAARNKIIQTSDELLKLYKQELPSEYEQIAKLVKKSNEKLDKAIDIESDKLFDKLRDLEIGSAPMDVLTILASTGVVGWKLQQADDKDEKISIALKSGIPIIGGMATSMYCTLALVSAGPSLIVGLISGVLINKLGAIVDDYRKAKNEGKQISILEKTLPYGMLPVLKHHKVQKTQKAEDTNNK